MIFSVLSSVDQIEALKNVTLKSTHTRVGVLASFLRKNDVLPSASDISEGKVVVAVRPNDHFVTVSLYPRSTKEEKEFLSENGHWRPVEFDEVLAQITSPLPGHVLIKAYSESPKIKDNPTDVSLSELLMSELENSSVGGFDFSQKYADEVFHKQFRQVDVCDEQGKDYTIYTALCNSALFWEVYHDLRAAHHCESQS